MRTFLLKFTFTLFKLSNGDLKKVEDLTTDDFVSCAENSNDVGIDHSAVTNLKEVMENGSVKIGFSVGKNKIKVKKNSLFQLGISIFQEEKMIFIHLKRTF